MTTHRIPGVSIFPFCTSELGFTSTKLARQCVGCDFAHEAGLVTNKSGKAPNFCNPNVNVFPLPLGECSLCNKPLIDSCLAFLVAVCVSTVVLNVWSLAVWFTVKPKRPQVYFKLSLTTSDLLFGLIVLPEATYHMITTMYVGHEEYYDFKNLLKGNYAEFNLGWAKYFSPKHVKFSIAMLHITQGASLCSILLLSIDRHLAITKNIQYPSIMTKTRCLITILLTWLGLVIFTIIISFTAVDNWLFTASPSVFFLPLSEPPDSVDTQTYADPTLYYVIPLGVVFIAVCVVTMATCCALRKPVVRRSRRGRKSTIFSSECESDRTITTSPIAMATFEFVTSNASQQEFNSDDSQTKEPDPDPAGADSKLAVPAAKIVRWSVDSTNKSRGKRRNVWKRISEVFSADETQTCDTEHRKANRTLMLYLFVYAICVLPFAGLMFFGLFDDDLADITSSDGHLIRDHRSIGKMITVGIFLTSSIWNCVIYNVRNRDFRFATRALLKKFKSSLPRSM